MNRTNPAGRITALAAFALSALILACDSPTDPTPLAWEAELMPSSPAGVSGSVAVLTQAGRTEASILIENADPQTTYGWRINAGGCDQEGTVTGGQAVYADITTNANGSGTEEASFAELLRADGAYAARVMLPGTSGDAVVACGELERVR